MNKNDFDKIINEVGFCCFVDNRVDPDCLINLEDSCDEGDKLRAQGLPHTACQYWRRDVEWGLAVAIREAINNALNGQHYLGVEVEDIIRNVLSESQNLR